MLRNNLNKYTYICNHICFHRWRNSFIIATIFGVPTFVTIVVFISKYDNHADEPQITTGLSVENLIMFLLATPVQVRMFFNSFN